ncbi:hypothetical protein AMAG_15768 [Allomyces macrogynus ATCC 38327]|uniref:t-SNARE coiled-coil homology domain-containing protein n=1 Tax=Allomyces macrogynus (strain ATCC 38327) TaxID=578462 RepID=A0A0L0TAJ7_ALLM3|nr:hypothetical protein AMAG_15768 [Allomyces macrogynus ATCC 38327]|eukprot:KNE71559.1 hypothetical protein AMAG_15768 [Allomyces macrogynus ATCC 38327]
MTTMKDAIKRLKLIDEACNPKEKDAENQGLDEFTKLKKQISSDVKAVRQIIKERDDLLKVDKSSKKGVGSGTETAELSFKECENLDKARFNDKMAADRVNLFSGGSTPGASPSKLNFGQFNKTGAVNPSSALGGGALGGSPTSNAPAELPDIEVAEDLALIRQRNLDIDQELDEIGAGVQVLKQIAIQMGEEVDKQNEMLDKIDTKVDKAQEHLVSVNMKMKEALDGVMKGDKFLVNCVLLCVLLALIAYIASQLVK